MQLPACAFQRLPACVLFICSGRNEQDIFFFLAARGFVAAPGLSLEVASGGCSSCLVQGPLTAVSSLAADHRFMWASAAAECGLRSSVASGLRRSAACGIFRTRD